jgi:hypothetical protein
MFIITFWEHTKNERNIFICVAKSTQPTAPFANEHGSAPGAAYG